MAHTPEFSYPRKGSWGICTPTPIILCLRTAPRECEFPGKQQSASRQQNAGADSWKPGPEPCGSKSQESEQGTTRALYFALLILPPCCSAQTPLGAWFSPFLFQAKIGKRVRKGIIIERWVGRRLHQSRNNSSCIVDNLFGTSVCANWHGFISSLHKASEQKGKLAHKSPSTESKHNLTSGS